MTTNAGEPGTADRLDVHHASLVEDLEGGRVRILTQETQKGAPAAALAVAQPNPAAVKAAIEAARQAVGARLRGE